MIRPALATGLAACALLAGCGQEDPEQGAAAAEFGVNAQALQPLSAVGRDDEIGLHLDAIAELGFGFVRTNLDWQLIEPTPPSGQEAAFDWDTTDVWVTALAERGLRWQPTVMGAPTPSWALDRGAAAAGCGTKAPPARPSDYARLLAELARRYGRDGSFWRERSDLPFVPITDYELWNEPNHFFFWCPRAQPEAWAALAVAAARAIHAVDPDARVLSGGLSPFRDPGDIPPGSLAADEFVERALRAEPGLADEIDVVAVHPYGNDPGEAARTLAWFRRLLDRTALRDKPLSVNEFGWATSGVDGPVALDEDTRAGLVAVLTPAIAPPSCGVVALALHTWTTPEADPNNREHWFGIADPASADPYPTALAYAGQAARLDGRDPPEGADDAVPEEGDTALEQRADLCTPPA